MNIVETDGRKDALKKRIREKIDELRNYEAKVGVFGVTGVGKSSLCNALFGSDAAKVSDVAACTREPQQLFLKNERGNGGIYLIDVPGVGENEERDKEYFELYKKLMPELDLVIWVIKADDRAYTIAEKAYKEILLPHAEKCPTLFVINQADKMNPVDWDKENNQPSAEQAQNIQQKIVEISKAFDVSTRYIRTCSAFRNYGLVDVMNTIVDILPKEKKYAFVREANDDVVTEDAAIAAEKGIWDTVKEMLGNATDRAKAWLDEHQEYAIEYLAKTASHVIQKTINKIEVSDVADKAEKIVSFLKKKWF